VSTASEPLLLLELGGTCPVDWIAVTAGGEARCAVVAVLDDEDSTLGIGAALGVAGGSGELHTDSFFS